MAQTIALQRGSAAITWNGTSLTTLFTQSGGTATRVCIGGVSAYSSVAAPLAMGIFVKQSAVSVYTMIAFKTINSAVQSYSLDFFGGSSITTAGAQLSATNNTVSSQNIIGNTATVDYTAMSNFSGIEQAGGSVGIFLGGTQSNFEVCPQQFWIGAGDSVVMKFYNFNNTAATGNVGYSFTTITES